jgi:calcineurin-like phosphoesterase family protein
MSVYFIGDPHLGHKNIAKFRTFVSSCEDNTNLIVKCWKETITKNDVVFVMGDAAFDEESLRIFDSLKGRKILIKGNHDDVVPTRDLLSVFEEVHGIIKYKKFWLSHCPVHPDELRGKKNISGHIHHYSIMKDVDGQKVIDRRYLNSCVDVIYPEYKNVFISLDQVRSYFSID